MDEISSDERKSIQNLFKIQVYLVNKMYMLNDKNRQAFRNKHNNLFKNIERKKIKQYGRPKSIRY